MKSRQDTQPTGPELSLPKTILFASLVIGALLLGAEGALALFGLNPRAWREDPYVGFSSSLPLFVPERSDDGTAGFRTAAGKQRWFNEQHFPAHKSDGTRRIFCMGGSTTYGRPHDDRTSFCGWLRAFLTEAEPGRRYEVVNAGGISYASYRVAALMEELSRFQPDLFVVYSGHNEFLEERTYRSVRAIHPAVRWLDGHLSRTRLYSALRGVVQKAGEVGGQPPEGSQLQGEVSAILDRSIGPSAYQRDDELRRAVAEHYRFNLERMIQIAAASGAEILLITPADNLKDCSPFKSDAGSGLTASDQARWQERVASGRAHLARGDVAPAIDLLQQAVGLDPRRAEGHYLLGQALLQQGDYADAEVALRRARDEDICPLRALSEFQEELRRVAESRGVLHVDYPRLLEELSTKRHGHPVPGDELFLDHVHPTIEGHEQLAVAILDVLADAGWIAPRASWPPDGTARARQAVLATLDDRARGTALRNLAKVLSWAGKSEEAAGLAERALAMLPGDAESLFILGTHAEDAGDLELALDRYQAVLQLDPGFVKARNNLGVILTRLGRLDDAVETYRTVLRDEPEHPNARYNLANALLRRGAYAEAIAEYRTVLVRTPRDVDAHFNLARAYELSGNRARASAHYRNVIEIDPGDSGAKQALEWLEANPGSVEPSRASRAG